jgi:ketosteroid isomerase-like protein
LQAAVGPAAARASFGKQPRSDAMAASEAEKAIKQTIQARNAAITAKNVAGVMSSSAAGFVGYSLAPPLKGAGGKAGLAAWFDTWDGPIGLDLKDLKITAGPEVGFAHGLVRMTGRKTDGEAIDLWFRMTFGLKHTGRGWKIIHEHSSVPFYMDGSYKAAVDLRP